MEICRWSRQPKANVFMDWVWDIIENYRQYKVAPDFSYKILNTLTQSINTLTSNILSIHQDIQELKQSQKNRFLSEKKYPSTWYKKMSPKYKMLMDYFNCTRNELYSSIYKELEDTYDIDLNQIQEDYCYENYLSEDECYPMDAIEHNPELRNALTLLIDNALIKYGLQTEGDIKHFKRQTLFDKEPSHINDEFL